MGYCINLIETTASFKIENSEKILRAIQNLKGTETIEDSGGKHFSWVDNNFEKITDIVEMFGEWRWRIEKDGENYKIVSFTGEKAGDDDVLFKAIAPYMNDGFIQMRGEDDEGWKWIFENGELIEKTPSITW